MSSERHEGDRQDAREALAALESPQGEAALARIETRREIERLQDTLKEAERFMAYFAGETGGHFVGDGTPKSCLAQIRAALQRS